MIVKLPIDKKLKTLEQIEKFSSIRKCKIRDFAKFIGILGSCCLAVKYGWVHLEDFEREKYLALERNNDNFESLMEIPCHLSSDFEWWKNNSMTGYNLMRTNIFILEIFSDASTSGWGACCNDEKTHGYWNQKERNLHLNQLEL